MVQTFSMAMVTSLWILGFGSYLQAMDYQSYQNIGGAATPGNYATDVNNPCVIPHDAYCFALVVHGVGFMQACRTKPPCDVCSMHRRRTSGRIIAYGMCIVFIGVFVNLTARKVSAAASSRCILTGALSGHRWLVMRPHGLICAPGAGPGDHLQPAVSDGNSGRHHDPLLF